ncbi:putative polyketide hydroxylase [Seinonella peptonophila]|uniref:Putative polyketide hydroxylase n=1 Tax=Seinonella peptonophila TaxID=112248 RepID=A0A1M4SSL3_9BACL|nr:FAD-dependent monooxygenase [Seinonella peptonophila]SHE34987.1 putative polyketide hydroxylase [Seinonella peptonophila]
MYNVSNYDENTPVLIVGGSLVGLSTALFLSWHGIPCLLVERHANISPFSRAGGFNPRTLEIFRTVGVESAIREAAPDAFKNTKMVRVDTLVGKELGTYLENSSNYSMASSPISGCIIPQNILEPVLKEQASKLGADLRFATECVSVEQDDDGVSAVIRDLSSGQEHRVRARYLVAADGNKSPIRKKLGIGVQGPGTLTHQINIRFHADLQTVLRDRRFLVCFIANVQGMFGGNENGYFLSAPYDLKKESEQDFLGERGVELIRSAVGVPDLEVKIQNVVSWEMADWLADHFQQGRIFLAGDSAHVVPPTGAYGANTGIADAHNLSWKLATVIKEQAGSDLLSSYELERRPASKLAVEKAYSIYCERLNPEHSSPSTAKEMGYEIPIFGYIYHSKAVYSEDDSLYEDPRIPTGRPGTRAPHISLESNGQRISILDLFGRNFVLLAGVEGTPWCEAASYVAKQLNISLDAYCIDNDLIDVDKSFISTYGISPTGATLVRPDGFVAWRIPNVSEQPPQELERVLTKVLCR